eukprot:72991_1
MSHFPLDPSEHVWIQSWFNSPIYTYLTLTTCVTRLLIMPCLFCMYVYDVYQAPQPKTRRKKDDFEGDRSLRIRYNAIHVSTLLCISSAFVASILTLGNNLEIFQNACLSTTIALYISWIIAKISVYNVTLLRLECTFWGTQYAPNKRFLLSMYLVIHLVFITSVIYSLFFVESVQFTAPDKSSFCLYIIPTFLIFLPASLDLFVTPITAILFVKPLHKLLTVAHEGDQDEDIKQLVTKYVLLSSIGIFSNVFSSIWFGVTDIAMFNDMDSLVNPVCLFLMQTSRWSIYYCFCKCCHNAINRCLHKTAELQHPTTDAETTTIDHGTYSAKSWYQDPVNPTALSTVTVTNMQESEDKLKNEMDNNEEEFDSQRTTTSNLERGEFKRTYNVPPDKVNV